MSHAATIATTGPTRFAGIVLGVIGISRLSAANEQIIDMVDWRKVCIARGLAIKVEIAPIARVGAAADPQARLQQQALGASAFRPISFRKRANAWRPISSMG